MTKHDPRYIRTEKSIRQAFFALLEKRPYEKITVNMIVEKAGISRNAFYLHYYSKEKLLEDIMDSYVQELIERVSSPWKDFTPDNVQKVQRQAMDRIVDYLYTRRESCRILLSTEEGARFERKLIQEIAAYFYCSGIRDHMDEERREDFRCWCDHISRGIFGTVFHGIGRESYSQQRLEQLVYEVNAGAVMMYYKIMMDVL